MAQDTPPKNPKAFEYTPRPAVGHTHSVGVRRVVWVCGGSCEEVFCVWPSGRTLGPELNGSEG